MTRKFEGDRLVIATHNSGKMLEFNRILSRHGISLTSAAELGLSVPEETEDSYVGNALLKARAATEATGLPALADDSGLEIDSLNGAPGVFTADWAETPTGRDFTIAMERAWAKIQGTGKIPPYTARFCCTLVLTWPDSHFEVFTGTLEGEVVWPMRGEQGHGYDPMFRPQGSDITLGQMPGAEKDALSHRARALEVLVAECFT